MAISFVNTIPLFQGTPPANSASYTPGGPGNTLSFFATTSDGTLPSIALAMSGSAGGTFTEQDFFNTTVDVLALANFVNLSCASGAQTFTITDANVGTGFVGCIIGIEYSGVGAVGSSTHAETNAPGTGAGAILGNSVVVPSGSLLLALCINVLNSETITATAGTSRASSAFNASYRLVEYAGAGSAIQPAFTTTVGTGDYLVMQSILSPANPTPQSDNLLLTGQTAGRIIGTILTPQTAKVIDRCRKAIESIFNPTWKADLAHG